MHRTVNIIHLIYRYDIGGLEQVMTDVINHSPENFKHIVISLTVITPEARAMVEGRAELIELNKKPGNDFSLFWKLFWLFRQIRPYILQTYNLPTLEFQFIGFLARIKKRFHAEHGRDASDPHGKNVKYKRLRQLINPFVHQWIAVSGDLERWLVEDIGLPSRKVRLVYNGIDVERFTPTQPPPYQQVEASRLEGFATETDFVLGTIGRLDPVKNQLSLLDVAEALPDIKIAIVGSGGLHDQLQQEINRRNLQHQVWLPGARYNISELLNQFDVFVLPSIAEGVPMTILEAMASGLPVVASEVGGIPEVVDENCGILTNPESTETLIDAIRKYRNDNALIEEHGRNGRLRVVEQFSTHKMVADYVDLYS